LAGWGEMRINGIESGINNFWCVWWRDPTLSHGEVFQWHWSKIPFKFINFLMDEEIWMLCARLACMSRLTYWLLTTDGLRYVHIHDAYLEYVMSKSLETLLLCVLGQPPKKRLRLDILAQSLQWSLECI
jgi:hypothetical protein